MRRLGGQLDAAGFEDLQLPQPALDVGAAESS
jgi:hypothetical protein